MLTKEAMKLCPPKMVILNILIDKYLKGEKQLSSVIIKLLGEFPNGIYMFEDMRKKLDKYIANNYSNYR